MFISAHIGNVPVEEWLPFLVPVLVLYLYGRHQFRRRREAVEQLPDSREMLDADVVARVLASLADTRHEDVSPEYLPLLYPPGPDGATTAELVDRVHSDLETIERLLAALEDRGYVDLVGDDGPEQRVWLTVEGYDLVHVTEKALLAAATVATQPGSRSS